MTAATGRRELDADLAQALRRACGLSLLGSLQRGVVRRVEAAGAGLRARIRRGDPEAVAELVEAAVVGETYFFRDPEQLSALSRLAFRAAPPSEPLRIWCAGCATGEEAYSIAAALLEAGRAPGADRILATDVSRRALETARAGAYGGWSVRRPLGAGEGRWLRPRGDGYEVRPEARAAVEFRVHNLLLPAPPGPFDVVLCRNVLIYFDPALAREVLARVAASLRPGGWLALAPAELGLAAGLPLEPHREAGAHLLRRSEGSAAKAPGARAAPLSPPPPLPPAAPPRGRPEERCALPARPEPPRAAPQAVAGDPAALEFVRLAYAAEVRGDLEGAIDGLRRALYLEPDLALAHASLVPLYRRAGMAADAERARRNALRALEGVDDRAALPGAGAFTAGALRRALQPPSRRPRASGSETHPFVPVFPE
jgi:chemotaxis protein methyltransferase CheR